MRTKVNSLNKSASRTIDIIDLIAREGEPLTISQISKELNIPKSSTFDILYTLVEKQYLDIDDERIKTFKLGHRLFKAGIEYLSSNNLLSVAHPYLEKLMQDSGETVFLAIEDQGELVFIDKVEQPSSVRTTIRLGYSKSPIYVSSLGKAILASFPNERVKEITDNVGMIAVTENTVKSFDELLKHLDDTRRRGYSIENGEGNPEVACVGSAICDHTGNSVGAISIASPKHRMNEERFHQLGKIVSNTALEISKKTGFMYEDIYYKFK